MLGIDFDTHIHTDVLLQNLLGTHTVTAATTAAYLLFNEVGMSIASLHNSSTQ